MEDTNQNKLESCGIHKDEKGLILILAIALIAILALVGTFVVNMTTKDIKISANYRDSIQATYIAEAGVERAKAELRNVRFDDVLAGSIGTSTGILSFGTSTFFANGTYTVRVFDDDDLDGNILNDSNGKVKIIGTGTASNGSRRVIEMEVSKFPFDEVPAAISFIENNNGDVDEDEIRVTESTGTILITGFDTMDGSPTEGDNPNGDDKAGLATQEAFDTTGGGGGGAVDDPADLETAGLLKGSPSAFDSGAGIGGPSEATVKSQVAFFIDNADISIPSNKNKLSQINPSLANFGTSSNPKITHIEDDFDIDQDITGYGVLVVEGRLSLDKDSTFNFHGVIYIVCRGQYVQNRDGDNLNVWGAFIMVTYDEPGCSSISKEERFELKKGNANIYYSSDAINKFTSPFTFSVDSWREAF